MFVGHTLQSQILYVEQQKDNCLLHVGELPWSFYSDTPVGASTNCFQALQDC